MLNQWKIYNIKREWPWTFIDLIFLPTSHWIEFSDSFIDLQTRLIVFVLTLCCQNWQDLVIWMEISSFPPFSYFFFHGFSGCCFFFIMQSPFGLMFHCFIFNLFSISEFLCWSISNHLSFAGWPNYFSDQISTTSRLDTRTGWVPQIIISVSLFVF